MLAVVFSVGSSLSRMMLVGWRNVWLASSAEEQSPFFSSPLLSTSSHHHRQRRCPGLLFDRLQRNHRPHATMTPSQSWSAAAMSLACGTLQSRPPSCRLVQPLARPRRTLSSFFDVGASIFSCRRNGSSSRPANSLCNMTTWPIASSSQTPPRVGLHPPRHADKEPR
ncbi:hypothetical protein VTO42DRAFT_1932 [Malbranchea cinnamomea]